MAEWFPFVLRKKYQKAIQAVQILAEREKDAADATLFRERVAGLPAFAEANRYQLLALETLNGNDVAVFINKEREPERTLALYSVSRLHIREWICLMHIKYSSREQAHLIDWYSRDENAGYGSLLLKHAISFLKYAGFSSLEGAIRPIDFDYEDKLRHIYRKFGFEITDFPNERKLFLNLKGNR